MLILISAASHSTTNCPSEGWKALFDEANGTTSSANSRDGIRRPPNPNPSAAWLRQEIQFMKIMKRTSDNGQTNPRPGTGLTYCWQCEPSFDSDKTEIKWRITEGHLPHTPRPPPTGHLEGHGHKPSSDPQNTCGLFGQTPMTPPVPSQE